MIMKLRKPETIVFLLALIFYAATMFPESPYNEQVRQAYAFLHGHVQIDAPNSFLEHAQVGPYSYALHPPLAPILLMPFVAIWGMSTNQTMCSVLIAAVGVVLAWTLFKRLELPTEQCVWLTVFFGIGTIFWYEGTIGTTWALPIVTCAVFLLAMLIELFGANRPLWIGIWGALACLARYDAALAMPVIALLSMRKGRTISEMLWIAPAYLVVGVFFVWLNEVRYNNFFDQGLEYIPNVEHGHWSGVQYLPGNLYTLLFMSPKVDGTFPYLHPSFAGQALTLTSPAFVLALRPSFKRLEVVAMGLCAVLISIPSLVHSTNGFSQFGARFYIQAYPFLLAMLAMGMPPKTDQLTKILIVVSVILVAFGVWHVHEWGLAGP
jgi:hypothetical protein